MIKYTVRQKETGFYATREYGDKMLFPTFDTLRDLHIFMRHVTPDYEPGVVGNVQIEYLNKA